MTFNFILRDPKSDFSEFELTFFYIVFVFDKNSALIDVMVADS